MEDPMEKGGSGELLRNKANERLYRTSASCPNMLRRWAKSSTAGRQAFDHATSARWRKRFEGLSAKD